MAVKPIPDGYHSVTPYLIVDDAAKAIEFYKKAFGAVELMRMAGPDGKVGHAEVKIGNSPVMLADENLAWGAKSAKRVGGSPVGLMIYVEDCDTMFKRAIAEGGREDRPLQDQFYGDRSGTLTDPFGLQWTIATHIKEVSMDEMMKAAAEKAKEMPQAT
jgi:PhnB protein